MTLGACAEPQERHWIRLLKYTGERYREAPHPLSARWIKAVRSAYLNIQEISVFPSYLPWLLDEEGRLHTSAAAAAERFLVDDDVILAKRLREMGEDVSFADVADPRLRLFFARSGVKSLAQTRHQVDKRTGSERAAPYWFQSETYIKRLVDTDFASALKQIVVHDFRDFVGALEGMGAVAQRLRNIERIEFVDEISVSYQIGTITVEVSERSLWENRTIYLTWVRSHAELHDCLARVVAQECMPQVDDQRRIQDAIYRLITCESRRDTRQYLEGRGIKWEIARDDVGEEDEQWEDTKIQDLVHSSLVASINTSSKRRSGEPVGITNEAEETAESDNGDAFALPPIEEVAPVFIEPSEGWSPSPSAGRRSGGGGAWRPPKPHDVIRNQEVGRHGEEVAYNEERKRVRCMGYPEDRVVWVADSNPGADYDIRSVDDDGTDLFIEVKSTLGDDGKFRWPRAEFEKALRERQHYILYRVYRAGERSPKIRHFRDPVAMMAQDSLRLDVETLRAEVEPLR